VINPTKARKLKANGNDKMKRQTFYWGRILGYNDLWM
jgi:hypothetical protein